MKVLSGLSGRLRRLPVGKLFFSKNFFLPFHGIFPQQNAVGFFLQRIFLMRFSVPFLTGFSDNKTPLCGISPCVFSFFFLRGSLSFRRWFSHPFISRISCFPLWDFSALPLRFFPSLSPAEFPSDMRQRKLPELSGSFLGRKRFHFSRKRRINRR